MGLFTKDIKTIEDGSMAFRTSIAADYQTLPKMIEKATKASTRKLQLRPESINPAATRANPPCSRHPLQRAIVLRVTVGDLRTHQDDLRRVVDPDQHDDDRSGGTIGRFQSLLTNVEANRRLPDLKE